VTRPEPGSGLGGRRYQAFTRRTSTCPDDKSQENRLVLRNNDDMGVALMETMALTILCWAAANLVIATVWTAYCLWPRRHSADASMDGAHRRPL
jgi:hypothetical protein